MRYEFKFVVDGAELTKEQQLKIADAVAGAGTQAVGDVGFARQDNASFYPPEWLGKMLRLLEGQLGEEVRELTAVRAELMPNSPMR